MQNHPSGIDVQGYRLGRHLGSGAMGVVYAAERLSDGLAVAIKIIHADHVRDPGLVTRFVAEASVLTQIDHANVIKVFECATAQRGLGVLVMELIEGESLRAVLDRDGSLPISRAISIAAQVALGVGAVHARGIVHRDLKPDNVMLSPGVGRADLVKVLDFGVAKVIDATSPRLTITGTIIGTPDYMAPELIGKPILVSPAADIYSLGCMLFEMCTGVRPFAASGLEVLVRQLHDAPPSPRALNPEVPAWLEALTLRAMSKVAADRFPSMQAMANELLSERQDPAGKPRVTTLRGHAVIDTPASVDLHNAPTFLGERPSEASNEDRRDLHEEPTALRAPTPASPFVPALVFDFADEVSRTRPSGDRTAYVPPLAPVRRSKPTRSQRTGAAWIGAMAAMIVAMVLGSMGLGRALHRPTPSLTIDTEPSGATVYDDELRLGTTPLVLLGDRAAETHQLRFEKDGYATLSATLSPVGTVRASFELTPRPAQEEPVAQASTPATAAEATSIVRGPTRARVAKRQVQSSRSAANELLRVDF